MLATPVPAGTMPGQTCPPLPAASQYPPTEDGDFWVYGPGRLTMTCGSRIALLSYSPTLDMKRSEERLAHQDTVAWLVETIGLSRARVADVAGVSRQTINRWQTGYQIQRRHWARLVGVADVLRRALAVLGEGDRVRKWLDSPMGSAGRTVMDLLIAGDLDSARSLAMSAGTGQVIAPDYLDVFGDAHPTGVREAHAVQFDELAEERALEELGWDDDATSPGAD
jgi:hypothetical protein